MSIPNRLVVTPSRRFFATHWYVRTIRNWYLLTTRYWYRLMTRYRRSDDLVFMNWGYEEDPPMALPLEPSDEPNRYFIQLYHRTATQVDLTGKQARCLRRDLAKAGGGAGRRPFATHVGKGHH